MGQNDLIMGWGTPHWIPHFPLGVFSPNFPHQSRMGGKVHILIVPHKNKLCEEQEKNTQQVHQMLYRGHVHGIDTRLGKDLLTISASNYTTSSSFLVK